MSPPNYNLFKGREKDQITQKYAIQNSAIKRLKVRGFVMKREGTGTLII